MRLLISPPLDAYHLVPEIAVCPAHFSVSLVYLLLQVTLCFPRLCYEVKGPRRPGKKGNKPNQNKCQEGIETFSMSFVIKSLAP